MSTARQVYDFRPGDVVQVKGVSGPMMAVSRVDEMSGNISVTWFDSEGRLQSAVIDTRILEPAGKMALSREQV